jgi:hypothetical protein
VSRYGRFVTSNICIGIIEGAFGLAFHFGFGYGAFAIGGAVLKSPSLQRNDGQIVRDADSHELDGQAVEARRSQ